MKTFKQFVENSQQLVIQKYLSDVQVAGYKLLSHQTDSNTAMKIVQGQDFGNSGVHGTTLFQDAAAIASLINKMNAAHASKNSGDFDGYRNTALGHIHKGADSIIIMAIPAALNIARTQDLDGHLIDLFHAKKIRSFGVPNQYIIGYWREDGQFFSNSRFNPKGLL